MLRLKSNHVSKTDPMAMESRYAHLDERLGRSHHVMVILLVRPSKPLTIAFNSWIEIKTRWRHQMETFSALLVLCEGNSPVTGEFPSQRSVSRSFDIFFDLNNRLRKQWRRWWFETPSRSLWRHCNESKTSHDLTILVDVMFILHLFPNLGH